MAKIRHNGHNIILIGHYKLVSGENEMPDDEFKNMMEHPAFKALVDNGTFSILEEPVQECKQHPMQESTRKTTWKPLPKPEKPQKEKDPEASSSDEMEAMEEKHTKRHEEKGYAEHHKHGEHHSHEEKGHHDEKQKHKRFD